MRCELRSGERHREHMRFSVYLLYWYQSTNTDAALGALRRGVASMRAAIKTRTSFSGRTLPEHELAVVQVA